LEIVRLENEVIISEIVFGMVHGCPYKGFPKNPPIYPFPLLITGIIYKNVEFFEKGKTFFKEQNVRKEKWRIFLGIFLLCLFFFGWVFSPTWNLHN
jgi:hypothetical protein